MSAPEPSSPDRFARTNPLLDELDRLGYIVIHKSELLVLHDQIAAVRKLHREVSVPPPESYCVGQCWTCRLHWPCPTIRALDGDS